MKWVPGGVTTSKDLRTWGVHCGAKSKKVDKEDLVLILSDQECVAVAVYTMNRVKAAPLYITMEHLEDGTAQDMAANSGNANACCPMSHEYAEEMVWLAARATGRIPVNFVVASTGVIGQTLNVTAVRAGMPAATASLATGPEGSGATARTITTTDTVGKELVLAYSIGGRTVTFNAVAKGSGVIHPNMGIILCFVTAGCAITREMLPGALRRVAPRTFNWVAVGGDAPTSDTRAILTNGVTGNPLIEWKDDGYTISLKVPRQLCQELARTIAGDGEGASHLITRAMWEVRSEENAERLAKTVVGSPLVEVTIFGVDINWGQVPCAMGYSETPFRPEYVDTPFSFAVDVVVACWGGMGLDFDEEAARSILSQDEVVINVHLREGEHEVTRWGYDLMYGYVRIDGGYRT